MCRIAVVETETNVDQGIGAFGGHDDAELLDETACIRRADLPRRPHLVDGDPTMPVDRKQFGVIGFIEHSRGSVDVVEVGVDHRGDRPSGVAPKFDECRRHFLYRVARVEGNDSVGRLNERLVRQSVADETPHTGTHRIKVPANDFVLGEVIAVYTGTVRRDNRRPSIDFETTCGHFAPSDKVSHTAGGGLPTNPRGRTHSLVDDTESEWNYSDCQ